MLDKIKKYRKNALNSLIRAFSLLPRIIIIFILAKSLSIEEFAYFGIFMAYVGIYVFVIGFDYYAYANREYITSKYDISIAIGKIVGILPCYIVTIILTMMLRDRLSIDNNDIILFIVIVAIEHIYLELYRHMVALKRQFVASMFFFLRMSVWPLIVLFLYASGQSIDKDLVLRIWIVSGSITLIPILAYLLLVTYRQKEKIALSRDWILKGYSASAIFFLSTILARLLFVVDREFILQYGTAENVAQYVFIFSCVFTGFSFIESSIITFRFASIVEKFDNPAKMIREIRQTIIEILVIAVSIIIVVPFLIYYILLYTEKPEFLDNYYLYTISLCIIATIYSVTMSVNIGLYACKMHRYILAAEFLTFLAFMGAFYLSSQNLGALHAVILSLFVSALAKLFFKSLFLSRRIGRVI